MKLIFCPRCGDLFKLRISIKSCECGLVKGRYLCNLTAEVSEKAISVAIGNGSFYNAIDAMSEYRAANPEAGREDYIREAKIEYAWVRPNSGPGNPHCDVIE